MIKNFFIDMSYGSSLRQKRQAAKLSQDKLAELVTARGHSITGAYVSMIEREYDKTATGRPTRVNKDFVIRAAELLNWDINAALLEADYAPLEELDLEGMFSGYRHLSPDAQRLARRQIKAILDSLADNDKENTVVLASPLGEMSNELQSSKTHPQPAKQRKVAK